MHPALRSRIRGYGYEVYMKDTMPDTPENRDKIATFVAQEVIKEYFGEDIRKKHDLYVQFLQTYEGVEGDSASIAVATAIISALKKVPIKQDYAMTGSLSVRGGVLPVGGVSSKIEAAIEAGIKKVIVPKTNLKDIILDADKRSKIEIIPVEKISEVLREALYWKGKESILKKIIAA